MVLGVWGRGWPNWQSVTAGSTCVEGSGGKAWVDVMLGGCGGLLCALFFSVEGTISEGPCSSESSVRESSGRTLMGGIGFWGDLCWRCVVCGAAGGCGR